MSSSRRLNWAPIQKVCVAAAEKLGHQLGGFDARRSQGRAATVKMASCEKCYGCCWIGYSPSRGFGTGGRLLIYRCGTPEAAGMIGEKNAPAE